MKPTRGFPAEVRLIPVIGIGEVRAGDDLVEQILAALSAQRTAVVPGDVVVIASKVVAKAEGAVVAALPGESSGDARRRLTLDESVEVLAETPHVIVVRTTRGLVCANAGIDASNVAEEDAVLLLPRDPDAAAQRLRGALEAATGVAPLGIVISDTFGRAWRVGQTDVAIGASGVPVLRDERGTGDRHGRILEVTAVALADEIAAAADLVRRKADGVPVVVVRGLPDARGSDAAAGGGGGAADLIRPEAEDLFAAGRGWLAARIALGQVRAHGEAAATPRRWRRGGRSTVAHRRGPLRGWEQERIAAALAEVGAAARMDADGMTVRTTDGPGAGLALAMVLDLGYGAMLAGPQQGGWWEIHLDTDTSLH